MRAFITFNSTICRPWNSVDSIPTDYGGEVAPMSEEERIENQKQIEICMNCPYPECINCLEGGKQCKRGRPKKVRVTFNA